ncbi:MAG: response regulator transcription factor [Pseudonocardia sp.]|nr:response regulator transcription factor [Pseudonocardia sp.]
MGDSVTVILVDDHEVVREGVRAFLSTRDDIDVVGEADGETTGVALAAEVTPDVALVDLIMGDGDGVSTTRRIRQVSPRTQVVVLTSFDDRNWVIPALRAGALSYVLKDLDGTELADVVRRAGIGEAVLHPRVAGHVVRRLHHEVAEPSIADLTARELEVLRIVAQGRNNAEIAAELVVSEKTVKGHVSNVLAKLQVDDRTQAAVFAWRTGIVHEPR